MGGDRGDAQGPYGVPPLGSAMDHRDDGKTRGRRRVGVPIGRGGNLSHGAPTHRGVNQEAADKHNEEGVLPPIEEYYPFSVTLEIWLFTITLLLG